MISGYFDFTVPPQKPEETEPYPYKPEEKKEEPPQLVTAYNSLSCYTCGYGTNRVGQLYMTKTRIGLCGFCFKAFIPRSEW